MCTDKQSSQWLIKAIDNHRLGSGARLKATVGSNLIKTVKVALRTKKKTALSPGLHTEHWRVQDRLPEPKGQRLILFIDRDSFKVIKQTGYKMFTGLTQGTVKVLSGPEAVPICEEGHHEPSILRICY
jgi:hypothetical protein